MEKHRRSKIHLLHLLLAVWNFQKDNRVKNIKLAKTYLQFTEVCLEAAPASK